MLVFKGKNKGVFVTMDSTLHYYNQHGEEYYKQTVDVDMSDLYCEFLQQVEEGGHILDLGCGSGRDSRYFLDQGYQVTAVDGSRKMCELSSRLLGQEVLQLKFSELDFREEFDGIWACASLLHVKEDDLPFILEKLIQAAVPGGVVYMSFKYGTGEECREGRLFNYYNKQSIGQLIADFPQLETTKLWITEDKREDSRRKWLNVLVKIKEF
jgi:SAM-dependent methyltransferase